MFSVLLFASTLCTGIADVESEIQAISDSETCLNTFQHLIEKELLTTKISPHMAESGSAPLFKAITYWREAPIRDLPSVAWGLYQCFIQTYFLSHGVEVNYNKQFLEYGFTHGAVDEELNQQFLHAFQTAKPVPFSLDDCDPNYLATDLTQEMVDSLNRNHTYVQLTSSALNVLKPILLSLKEQITECLGTPWRVASVRAWKTLSSSIETGPNSWHTDGCPFSALKIMYYPRGASSEKGTVELQLAESIYSLDEEKGTWLLFKNSEIVHRGRSPQAGERVVIEITILPSLTYDLTPICAGQNARHPILPWQRPLYKREGIVGVNVGGGPNWSCPGWRNLEEVTSAVNPDPFYLSPDCRFPFYHDSIQSVYTSHAIEHLDLPTVCRIFSEAHRILEKGGNLIIKIPDYDKALDCWRRQDPSFFGPEWGIQGVSHRWGIRGIHDCLDHRASMIFCSFFNEAYGNPFGGMPCPNPQEAYFGPAAVSIPFLRTLIQNHTPSEIAQILREIIGSTESHFRYCHQSAWSREELQETLSNFGFEVFSFDPDLIIHVFGPIPGMEEMQTMSTFCWAKKI